MEDNKSFEIKSRLQLKRACWNFTATSVFGLLNKR